MDKSERDDIKNRRDIEKLVESFYNKALDDEKIGYIFKDVAKLDLAEHLPIIADFWEMMLLGSVNFQEKYRRSPMLRHIELNEKEALKTEHFQQWLKLFAQTVDEIFSGTKADLAKFRAESIAATMFQLVSRKQKNGISARNNISTAD